MSSQRGIYCRMRSAGSDGVRTGRYDRYGDVLSRLAGKRVALLANHTSRIGERHLVDILHARGFDVTAIFAPEHGFRGTADPGEHMGGSVDAATGIPIRSLCDGNTRRPSDEAMHSFEVA